MTNICDRSLLGRTGTQTPEHQSQNNTADLTVECVVKQSNWRLHYKGVTVLVAKYMKSPMSGADPVCPSKGADPGIF